VKQRRLGVQLDIAGLQAYGLTDANTGARHQSEKGLIGMKSQRSSAANGQRCVEKSCNLIYRI
jgi:hypothetical protein